MLEQITGTVGHIGSDGAVIVVGGVGLRVQMTTADLANLKGTATVHTVLQIRDDEVHLYGFASERGRELFKALTTVSGVGPKVALAALSFHGNEGIERVVVTGDLAAMKLVPGVGKKTAERILLELRDKFGAAETSETPAGSNLAEVRDGLRNLGYSAQEIQAALSDLPVDGDVDTLLRHALKALGTSEKVGGHL